MTLRKALASVLLATPLLLYPSEGASQEPTPQQCDSAVVALAAGSRPLDWFWIVRCGAPGAEALANAIRDERTETDSVFLETLWASANQMQHPELLGAALEVATDPSASQPARITSMLVMMNQIERSHGFPLYTSWTALMTVPRGLVCTLSGFRPPPLLHQDPLPGALLVDAADALDALATSANESAVVRDMARCVRRAISSTIPEDIDPAVINLTYICGNRFAVSNASTKWITVLFQVVNTQESGSLNVAPGGVKRVFTTLETGTVEIEYLGNVVETLANGGVACP